MTFPTVMPAPRAILFDLDGTLADTAPDLAAAVNWLRTERGLDPTPYEVLRPTASAVSVVAVSVPADTASARYSARWSSPGKGAWPALTVSTVRSLTSAPSTSRAAGTTAPEAGGRPGSSAPGSPPSAVTSTSSPAGARTSSRSRVRSSVSATAQTLG